MARMIPPVVDPSTLSNAERRLFSLFEHAAGTQDWTVLHSLGLGARGRKKPYGEIDFVVMAPGVGTCCLEVKGGRIACQDGVWSTTDAEGRTSRLTRSPFMQVRDGMFALKQVVAERGPYGLATALAFSSGVVFPDIAFEVESPEWFRWQVIDRDSLQRPLAESIIRLIREQRALERQPIAEEPTPASIATARQLLRPDFEIVVSRAAQISTCEERLLALTEEQYGALDLLSENQRCLFKGAAGTGKTMLALEYARRTASGGAKTLLVCFNRLLGDWLTVEARNLGLPSLTASSFHRFMRDQIVASPLQDEFLQHERAGHPHLFDEIYPTLGQLALSESGSRFDVLVVDEVQDLINAPNLACLGELLTGGLMNGRWAMFGDFERQAIFGRGTGLSLERLLTESSQLVTVGRLKQNCRNTRYIAEETAMLSGFESLPYRPGQVAGAPVDYLFHSSADGQTANLVKCISGLLQQGVSCEDIVVLSKFRFTNSSACRAKLDAKVVLAPLEGIGETRKSVVRFSTIQAFKGMESPVVVLVDVDEVAEAAPQCLLYVAMSRARSHLMVLAHEGTRNAMNACLRRSLLGGGSA